MTSALRALAVCLLAAAVHAAGAQERLVFTTDWLAESEHGGMY